MSVAFSNPSAPEDETGARNLLPEGPEDCCAQKVPDSLSAARDALAEILASQAELQEFVVGLFDRLDELVQREIDNVSRVPEENPIQGQIDQLSAVAAELADLVTEQKRWLTKRHRH